MNPWTDENIETLRRLVSAGFSASHIAKEIGGVSRNAVIGKVTRMGLDLHGQTGRPDLVGRAPKKPVVRTPRMPKKKADPVVLAGLQELLDRAPPPEVETILRPESLGLTLMELENHNCRWPDGEREHITFCGHQIEEGRSYCPYHVRLSRGKGTESERRATRELVRAA